MDEKQRNKVLGVLFVGVLMGALDIAIIGPAMPAIQAAGEGWDVTVITDASGATSVEAHEVAIQRMAAAGVNLMTWLALASEWQRDWAREETAIALNDVVLEHAAGSGIAFLWEQQLLNSPVPAKG